MTKMFRKLLVLMLVAALMSGMALAEADVETTDDLVQAVADVAPTDDLEQTEPMVYQDSLIVGSLTQLSGGFFTEAWGNNTADVDVRALLHGYGTVTMTGDGFFAVDTSVVSNVVVETAENGDKTYTFELAPTLTYSDGSPIAAADYVFSVLLQSCPELVELGGKNLAFSHLVGYDDYASGASEVFSGVRLLDEYSFSLTIKGANLPYFYELMMVNVNPYPIFIIAPDCEVLDEGEGAFIAPIEDTEGEFTVEVLTETILDPETGYRTHPSVVSGPYMLTSYEEHVAEFEANPYYQGNFEGQLPDIKAITFKQVFNETMLEELQNGTVELINKASSGEKIIEGMQLVTEDLARAMTYLRTGFSFLAFACEQQPTASEAVRKAVYMCMNVDAMIADYLQGYGMDVFGYYGYGQWMVTQLQEQLVELDLYEYSAEAARDLLIADGWTLNERGETFDAAIDTVRYKMIDDALTPLVIRWAKSTPNESADYVFEMLTTSFALAGIGLEVTEMSYAEMLAYYYRDVDRSDYNMFYLATNFNMVFDPYLAMHVADEYQGIFNTTGIRDERLMQLADDLRKTEGEDIEGYLVKWLAFQSRWAELLPMAPLYSNVYYDFHVPDLYNYDVNTYWSWSAAILYSTFDPAKIIVVEELPEDELPTVDLGEEDVEFID